MSNVKMRPRKGSSWRPIEGGDQLFICACAPSRVVGSLITPLSVMTSNIRLLKDVKLWCEIRTRLRWLKLLFMVSSNSWRKTHDAKNRSALPCGALGELSLMSGELFVTVKLKARSSAVSVFCCSGKLEQS